MGKPVSREDVLAADQAHTHKAEIPHGMVAIIGPDGASCSFAGVSYEPDEDGVLIVPVAAVHHLASHGFVAL